MVDAMCQRYHALPCAGGVLDQPARYMFRLLGVLAAASGASGEAWEPEPVSVESEVAALMETLG